MASGSDPKSWVTYVNNKDCSQGFCSINCPQWCYINFSPPPPIDFPDNENSSNPNFSPLVISVIGIFASAFLLVSYYTIISKYCGNTNTSVDRSTRGRVDGNLDDPDGNLAGNQNPSVHEPWQESSTGLDEALIKLIRVCKYRKRGGLIVEGTDCPICLGEFREDETLRILPKCSHAFHVPCIDRWLKSHSNCPLCRANINFLSSPSPTPFLASQTTNLSENRNQNSIDQEHDSRRVVLQETQTHTRYDLAPLPNSPILAFIDSGKRDTVIEIRDDFHNIGRSVSMDRYRSSHSRQLQVADVLRMSQEEEDIRADLECSSGSS